MAKRHHIIVGGLLALLLLTAAAYLYEKHSRGIDKVIATRFQLPGADITNASVDELTSGRFDSIGKTREALRERLEDLDFRPYLERAPGGYRSHIRKIEENGWQLRGNPAWEPGKSFDWGANPKNDRNWHFKLNALDSLLPYAASYEAEADEESFLILEQGIFDWIRYNLSDERENAFKWYDMSTGLRAAHLANLLYWGIRSNQLDDAELRLLLAAMAAHVEVLSNPRLLNHGNHGLFQMLGLAAMCKVAPLVSGCGDAKEFANEQFKRIAVNQFTVDGLHAEHSSQYHPWAIRMIEEMLSYDYFGNVNVEFLEQARERAIHYFYPDGDMTLLGDTGKQHACSLKSTHAYLEYLCTGGKQGRKPPGSVSVFKESGYAFIRDSWDQRPLTDQSYLLVNGAYHSQAHKQADDLAFVWYDFGRKLLVDSGKYSYDKSKMRQYMVSTRAHNTVEIDAMDYPRDRHHAFGSAIENYADIGGIHVVSLAVEREEMGIKHWRHFVFQPKSFLLVVDHIASRQERNFTQWFHFDPSLNLVDKDLESFRVSSDDFSLEVLTTVVGAISGTRRIEAFRGVKEPVFQGWRSSRYKQVEENLAIGISGRGSEMVFATVFGRYGDAPVSLSLKGDQDEFHICPGSDGLRLALKSGDVRSYKCDLPAPKNMQDEDDSDPEA